MKRAIGKAVEVVDGALITAVFSAFGALNSYAEVDISWLQSDNGGAFENLEETAKATMGSFYSLSFTVATGLCVIFLIGAFLKLALYQGQMREQQKGAIFYILLAMAGICGAISIFSLVAGVSEGMFTTTTAA